MLILQRKAGESLFIGEDIQISIVSVDPGGRVRLAIDAPRTLPILRSELRSAMNANQEAATEEAPPLELLSFLEGVVGQGER
ncbi:MAG: csrA [Paenibacillus sp.]|jgi:carbon storage regulator|nr:csrA [Paenibacillus sp.]